MASALRRVEFVMREGKPAGRGRVILVVDGVVSWELVSKAQTGGGGELVTCGGGFRFGCSDCFACFHLRRIASRTCPSWFFFSTP